VWLRLPGRVRGPRVVARLIELPNNVEDDLYFMIQSPKNVAGRALSTFSGDLIMK